VTVIPGGFIYDLYFRMNPSV